MIRNFTTLLICLTAVITCKAQDPILDEFKDPQCAYRIPAEVAVNIRRELLAFEEYLILNEILLDKSGRSYENLMSRYGDLKNLPDIKIDTTLHFIDSIGTYIEGCIERLIHVNEKLVVMDQQKKFLKKNDFRINKLRKYVDTQGYENIYIKLGNLLYLYHRMAAAHLSLAGLNLPTVFDESWDRSLRKQVEYHQNGKVFVNGKYSGKQPFMIVEELGGPERNRTETSFLMVVPKNATYFTIFHAIDQYQRFFFFKRSQAAYKLYGKRLYELKPVQRALIEEEIPVQLAVRLEADLE